MGSVAARSGQSHVLSKVCFFELTHLTFKCLKFLNDIVTSTAHYYIFDELSCEDLEVFV